MQHNNESEIIHTARELLSGCFKGILATHSIECTGYPIGSLLPYSLDRDGWPLILVSHLAKHTRNLAGDPHCSLTITEDNPGDTQTLSRLSCLADAIPARDLDSRTADRHFRYLPESRGYYQELNFLFYRLKPVRFYCVAGFGAARWIGIDRMQAINPFTFEEEERVLADINSQFGGRLMQRLAQQIDPRSVLIAVGLDATGLDLRQSSKIFRLPLPAPAKNPSEFLSVLTDWL